MKTLQRAFIVMIFLAIVLGIFGLEVYDRYTVPILIYHNAEPHEQIDNLMSVSIQNFEYQMAFLKRHNFHVISLTDFVLAIREKRSLPHNSVVITFDDGYADNYYHAFPVLKKYGFPATIFVVAGTVGQKGFLTWEQMKEMQAFGIDFGSHTLTHPHLPDLSPQKQRKEIFESKRMIESRLGRPAHHFSYPWGGFNDESKQLVAEAGYWSACTTNRGPGRFHEDLYALKRIRLSNKDNVYWNVLSKLSGYYNFFRKSKNPY